MYFGGIAAHLKYVSVAVLDRLSQVALETTVPTRDPARLLATLEPFRPLKVVVETCPFWPWLYDLLVPAGIGFHLAHAKQLRAIAAAPQKNDAVDARLLARMLLSGLIPEAYPRSADQRELLRLLRHRAPPYGRAASDRGDTPRADRSAHPADSGARAADPAGRGGAPHCCAARDDSRDRPVSQPPLGGGAAADHPVRPGRARSQLRRLGSRDAELGRSHAPREHPPGGESLGP